MTNENIIKRWNKVMNRIGLEHETIEEDLSELEQNKKYYNIENGITIEWMIGELNYWRSCYDEPGNVRYEDKKEGPDEYKIWVSETGMIDRLSNALQKEEDKAGDRVVYAFKKGE